MKTADCEDHWNKKGLPQVAEICICDSAITLSYTYVIYLRKNVNSIRNTC